MGDGTHSTQAGGHHVTITRHIAQRTPGRVTYEVRVGGVACTSHRTLSEAQEAAGLARRASSAREYVEAQIAREVCSQCGAIPHGYSDGAERAFSMGESVADGTARASREAQLEAALTAAMTALVACQTALDCPSWRATQGAREAIGEAIKAADPFLVDALDDVCGGAR